MQKILIVDDSETVRSQLTRALTEAGFLVVGASDGVKGLEASRKDQFSLILLDIVMPRMGGMELLAHLKQDPATRSVPVLVLTTEMHESMIQRAKQAGAAGWIIKPVKMHLLVEAVSKLASGAET